MNFNQDVAAHNLEGQMLVNDWIVDKKIEKGGSQTGSHFSVGYIVKKDGKEAFLKAFNVHQFLVSGGDFMKNMTNMLNAFNYERELSELCQSNHVTKVSFVIEHGQANLNGYTIPVVPYLIFERADGDIRAAIDFSSDLNTVWKFFSLHEIAIGLKQLHTINVSHQDLKPSNILVYNEKQNSKICDLGRSVCFDKPSYLGDLAFTGDFNYSPPEMWYGYYEKDLKKRSYAIDCYMLGSLMTFYFAGNSMSSMIRKNIDETYAPGMWRGSFDEIESYLQDAYAKALEEISLNIKDEKFYKQELIELITLLCNPFPKKRGHPKSIINTSNSYSLERFISKLDKLRYKSEINLKRQ